ncbi:MAG: serine hydrolase [Verrucomicrobiota bacterium]
MHRRSTRLLLLSLLLLALLTAGARLYLIPAASMACGYSAKVMATAVFASGRDPNSVQSIDLAGGDLAPIEKFTTPVVHHDTQSVTTSSLGGLVKRTAQYHPTQGATLLPRGTPLLSSSSSTSPSPDTPQSFSPANPSRDQLWPRGNQVEIPHLPALEAVVAEAFAEPNPEKPRRTRALIIARNGRIIAERYGPNFDVSSRLPGWSMTKSVINALVGILIHQNKLTLEDASLLPEWTTTPDDPRADITLDQLLRMSSGLEFDETYSNPLSDVTTMLFRKGNTATFASHKPLLHPPGTDWSYASGTTNIISRIVRLTLADDATYHAFPKTELFTPLGMTTAVIERDYAGNFVGSSFMIATARDWARFGLLYLNDGLTPAGTRLLPEGWTKYSRTPAPAAPNERYAAHFWLRLRPPSNDDPDKTPAAPLPPDTFHMAGHEGQYLTLIPSEHLLILRLGLTRYPKSWNQEKFAANILSALAKNPE